TLPPSVLTALGLDDYTALETIIAAGEPCSASLVDAWGKGRRFFNAYGPTETTVCATMAHCSSYVERPTIGTPINNARAYIVDDDMALVPPGMPGEICIGGPLLARGYLGRPDTTADRFVPNPFAGPVGSRLYKTGDLGKHLQDGRIEFIRRRDNQV